jgi:hypothetical protein
MFICNDFLYISLGGDEYDLFRKTTVNPQK